MSAVAATTATARRPVPAREATAVVAPLEVQVTLYGVLKHNAEMRIERATGRAQIVCYVGQTGELGLRAVELYGDDADSAFTAAAKARTLLAGQPVRITGEGLRLRWEHGMAMLTVGRVYSIEVQA